TAGTQAITNISLDNSSETKFSALTAFKGKLYFFFNYQVWSSDGTSAGTQALGNNLIGTSVFVPTDSYLFFTASQSNEDIRRLWRTDGTATGTFYLGSAHNQTYSSRMGINN